jgi:hypothetical protein
MLLHFVYEYNIIFQAPQKSLSISLKIYSSTRQWFTLRGIKISKPESLIASGNLWYFMHARWNSNGNCCGHQHYTRSPCTYVSVNHPLVLQPLRALWDHDFTAYAGYELLNFWKRWQIYTDIINFVELRSSAMNFSRHMWTLYSFRCSSSLLLVTTLTSDSSPTSIYSNKKSVVNYAPLHENEWVELQLHSP